MSIIHTEVHVIHSPEEVTLSTKAGLPEVKGSSTSCANCAAPVARATKKFVPFALVLNEDTSWLVCLACASPLLFPKS